MLLSELPKIPTELPVRGFPGVWKLLVSWLPPRDGSPSLTFLSLFLSFIFCPTSFWRQWAAFLGAWCPPPVFRSCGICSAFKWSFDEFVGKKVVSLPSSSAIVFLFHSSQLRKKKKKSPEVFKIEVIRTDRFFWCSGKSIQCWDMRLTTGFPLVSLSSWGSSLLLVCWEF